MPTSDRVIGAGAWMLENGHRFLLAVTGGRFPKTVAGMKTLEIHVKGRKSGNVHSNMLTTPVYDDNRVVIIASKGGSQDHPDWYKNLSANPDIEVTIDGETKPMRARTASAEEKAELWPQVVKAYKGYAGYQKNTERDIPVVILEAPTV
ncbi:MAG TPA: nitroreductase/quinone reductase family protein [Mycobacteriales bacterium]|jgi:deazaflavin-dependent oxidoreductase (nitroreductase family)|nr:nitroreductase/quinone reductase family protein [Mycobacteriales bacterium]